MNNYRLYNIYDDLINNYRLYNIYDIKRNSSHLNVNTVILDIVSIFKAAAHRNKHHNDSPSPSSWSLNLSKAEYKLDDIIRVLSLLLDWDIHSDLFNNQFVENFNRYLYDINYYHHSYTKQVKNGKNDGGDLYNLLLIQDIKPCFGFIGDYQSITMLFPISSKNGGKWKMQSKFTSIYMLAISTLCMWLKKQIEVQEIPKVKSASNHPLSPIGDVSEIANGDGAHHHNPNEIILDFVNKELITFYSVLLPTNLNGFIEPSRNTISRSCLSSTSSLRKTSRLLLENMVERMEPNTKRTIILKWKNKFLQSRSAHSGNITNGHTLKNNNKLSSNGYLGVDNHNDDEKVANGAVELLPNRTTLANHGNGPEPLLTKASTGASSMAISDGYTFDTDGGDIPLSVLFNAIIICIIHNQQMDDPRDIEKNNNKIKERIIIDKVVSQSVIKILIATLQETVHHKSDEIKKSLCCYYLGRIITSWIEYCEAGLFIKLLNILLDLCSEYDDGFQSKGNNNRNGNILSESAMYALVECGISSPSIFIKTMGTQALQISKRGRHAKALQGIQRLIYTNPLSLLKYIPFTIKTIIRCLDPSSPQKRKTLLKATTSTLHALVHKFPNCSFHSSTQHFAIGTGSSSSSSSAANGYESRESDNNSIIIYDLRTATRFGKALKQHRSAITAIEFNDDGKYLVSYSAYEKPNPLLCCWKLNTNDGVLGFFGSQSKCIRIIRLNNLNNKLTPIYHITNTQLIWDKHQKNKIKLQREDKSVSSHIVI